MGFSGLRREVFSPSSEASSSLEKKSPEIYLEDLLTAAAATQSWRYIIHLFLRGYKTLVNYCLKCCPKTQRRSRTVCLSREWRHETTGQACNHSFEPCQCFYAFSFIEFLLDVFGLQKYTCRMWIYCDYFSINVMKSESWMAATVKWLLKPLS